MCRILAKQWWILTTRVIWLHNEPQNELSKIVLELEYSQHCLSRTARASCGKVISISQDINLFQRHLVVLTCRVTF